MNVDGMQRRGSVREHVPFPPSCAIELRDEAFGRGPGSPGAARRPISQLKGRYSIDKTLGALGHFLALQVP